MKSRDFCFWLQGCFELGGGEAGLNATQVAVIKQHLGLVFQHDTDIAAKPHAPITHASVVAQVDPTKTLLIC